MLGCSRTPPLFIRLPVGGHLGCFHASAPGILWLCSHGGRNTCSSPCFQSFWIDPEVELLEYGTCTFNFFEENHTVFRGTGSILNILHQQCTQVAISPHPGQQLFSDVLLIPPGGHDVPCALRPSMQTVLSPWSPGETLWQ